MNEWLPQLITALVALAIAMMGATVLSSENKTAYEHEWQSLLRPFTPAGYEARLPPLPLMVWAEFLFTALAGFYLAAAMAGWIHRG